MNDARFPDSWWLLSRVRGVGSVLRVLMLTSTVVAVGCTWLAAGHTVLVVDVVIVGLALVCVVLPDSHVGLLVVLVVGVEWLATVHDRTTPWSVGAAASLAVFHASMAAASCRPTGCDVDTGNVPPLDAPFLGGDACERLDVGRRSDDPRPSRSQQRSAGCSVLGSDRDRRAMGPRRHLGRRTTTMNSRSRARRGHDALDRYVVVFIAVARPHSYLPSASSCWSSGSR